jgi:DNA-directed DNA polymerase III PolC
MNRDEQFVHLHVHTEFSLLDGLSQIDRLVKRAKALEMPSLAITDHGTMFGVIDFFHAAVAEGIKPIIGMEAYLAPRTRQDRDGTLDKKAFHLLLLAKNMQGYQNLLKLASEAQLNGFYRVPRIDWDYLAAHSEGLVATTGCLGAQIPQSVMSGNDDHARDLIGKYQEVFGAENFFLELQYHNIDELRQVNQWLANYRKSGHTPVQFLATNDVHYVLDTDYDPHDTLLCIQTGNLKTDANRLRMSDASYHLTSHEEMETVIAKQYAWLPEEMRFEALYNTAKVAAMCDVDLNTKGYHLPRFPVPNGHTDTTFLRYLAEKGRYWRYGDRADDPIYVERMEHELNIINTMGFNTYFLIVWDLCEFARHADIWWNVRGSGAGSLVAYCLGITGIDPIRNSLIFERFLNPARKTMPDIDLDYPDDRRNEMIEYTASKYGWDKVASIITFGTMGAKAAIRDVGRALNVPLPEVNKAVSLIPTEAKQKDIEEYVDSNPDLKSIYQSNAQMKKVIDTAKLLQGVARHASTHAAGVIVADEPLVNYVPLHRLTRGDDENSALRQVTQFPMETCESLGLLKIDFLGLSTLTLLRRASDLIYKHHNKRWTMENIPYRPHEGEALTPEYQEENRQLAASFVMMGEGQTVGVFQVESPGMQQMLRGMRPSKYEHIVAGISLYRPGPMDYIPLFNARMQGKEETHYHHEKLRPILEETYGVITYQEQIMQVASEVFGYEMAEADLMRRAVSKKKEKDLLKHKEIFKERGPLNGVDVESAEKIFEDIAFFANYGFNKCLVGDTLILDADTGALHRIEDIALGKSPLKRVLSLDTQALKLIPQTVTDAVFNGVKPVYKLVTHTGKTITATANHPFFTQTGWRLLDKLIVGDVVAVAAVFAPALPDKIDFIPPTDADWDEIVSIEPAGEQATYDLTVEGAHNFVANDFIVHNSHAADYAMVTVQTAFLKCHYTAEYMAALLAVYREDSDKVAHFLEECGRLNIEVLPPDINASDLDFDIQVNKDGTRGIRFGLAAVKNVGMGAVAPIIEERKANGTFADLTDLCQRVDLRAVGKRALECLIKVGAFDPFGANRAQLLLGLDSIVSYSTNHHQAKDIGQMSLFDGGSGGQSDSLYLPPLKEEDAQKTTQQTRLGWEKELLGFYVTQHPVMEVRRVNPHLQVMSTADIRALSSFDKERSVGLLALISGVRALTTKSGDNMAIISVEDQYGTLECVAFPRTWTKVKAIVEAQLNNVVLVKGKFDMRNDDPQVLIDDVTNNFDVFRPAEDRIITNEPQAMQAHNEEPPPRSYEVVAPPPLPAKEPYSPPPTAEINVEDWSNFFSSSEGNGGAATTRDAVWITVLMERKGIDEVDDKRFRRIYNTFTEHPGGQDRFTIAVEIDGQMRWIDFDQQVTRWSPELEKALRQCNGVIDIQVEKIPHES